MEISVSQSKAIKKQLLGDIVPESSELGTGRSREKSLERQQAFKQLAEMSAIRGRAAVWQRRIAPNESFAYAGLNPEDWQ